MSKTLARWPWPSQLISYCINDNHMTHRSCVYVKWQVLTNQILQLATVCNLETWGQDKHEAHINQDTSWLNKTFWLVCLQQIPIQYLSRFFPNNINDLTDMITTWLNKSNPWQLVQTRSGYLVIGQTATVTDSQSLSSVVWQSVESIQVCQWLGGWGRQFRKWLIETDGI